jgi:opacity protein-like surface antigen
MTSMTKIALTAGLIAAFATPALAESGRIGYGAYHAATAGAHRNSAVLATQWYRTPNNPSAVFVGGTYAGSDPDPNIRAALAREFGKRP